MYPAVVRVATQADSKMEIDMPVSKAYRFLISNLTEGNVYVSLLPDTPKEEMFLIPSLVSRIVGDKATDKVYVISDTTSEAGVEVQCIDW